MFRQCNVTPRMHTNPDTLGAILAVAARRDRRVFLCIIGTLLAMAVVVYQGDYSGYKAALAELSAAT